MLIIIDLVLVLGLEGLVLVLEGQVLVNITALEALCFLHSDAKELEVAKR